MAHNLKIVVEDILQDAHYIRVIDWSQYDKRMPVTNRVLKVIIPGEEDFRLVPLPQSDSTTYTSKSFKLSKSVDELPDGLWTFTYSICPNERKFTVVDHFRTVKLHNKIMGVIAKIAGGCEIENNHIDVACLCMLKLHALKANSINRYNVLACYELYHEIESEFSKLHNALS